MTDRVAARERFELLFGARAEAEASAPGRVNLIGDHTDYNDGFVLPTAIPQRTVVVVRAGSGTLVHVASREQGDVIQRFPLGAEIAGRGWLDYLQGTTVALREAGHPVASFDAYIASDVPLGSGLSSSAALLVAGLRALRARFGIGVGDLQIAQIARQAENGFVGARVGIMDQMACSLADEGTALFLDTRSLAFRRVPIPPGVDLVVLNSGLLHSNRGGTYNVRRAECEAACVALGIRSLRELDMRDLARLAALPDPLGRRARHVVTENQRVLDAVAALDTCDFQRLGALFYASHTSMRDDYEVSVPEIDLIVELARARREIHGARLTGGGFGGSVVMLARAGTGRAVGQAIAADYAARTGREPTLVVPVL